VRGRDDEAVAQATTRLAEALAAAGVEARPA
jgi:hypothetical protein